MFALHSSVDGYMGFFHVLVFVSHAVMDLDVQISPLQNPTSNAFAYILSSGGDGPQGDSNFHLGRDLSHHFPRWFHVCVATSGVWPLVFLCPHNMCSPVSLIAVLMGVRCNTQSFDLHFPNEMQC